MSKRRPRSEHVRTYTPFVAEQSNHDQLAGVYSSLPFQFPAPLPREVEALVTVEHTSTVEETAAAPPEITLPTDQELGRISSVNSRIRPTPLATVEISSTVEHTSTVEETAAAPPEITLPTDQELGRISSVNSRIRPTTVEISSTVEHT